MPSHLYTCWDAKDGIYIKIICDFDGTVTTEDIGDLIIEHFCPPEIRAYARTFYTENTSAAAIDTAAYASLSQLPEEELIRFVRKQARIREGFWKFFRWTQEKGISFVLLSGGYDYYIRGILGDAANDIEIIANKVDFKNGNRLIHQRENPRCGECGNCKRLYCEDLEEDYYYIGDGPSDVCAATGAKLVFARHHLARYMKETGQEYVPFESFHEIRGYLEPHFRYG